MAKEGLEIDITVKADNAAQQINAVSKSLNGLNTSTKGANIALTNFGRVIQDAPFGILGIANNIDPLVQSFQNLKKETGSAGGAFKSLASSLVGPAGIAIGISAVTSLLIAFGPQISAAIAGISKLDQAQRDAAQKGALAYSKAASDFEKFTQAASDSGNSVQRQNDALRSANNLLADYGLKIKDLATFQKSGAEIGLIYAEIKREEAKQTFLAGKAAEAYAKSVVLTAKAQQGDALGLLGGFSFGDFTKLIATGGQATSVLQGVGNQFQRAAEEEKLFSDEAKKSDENIKTLIDRIRNTNGVVEDFGTKTKKAAKTTNDAAKALKAAAKAAEEAQKLFDSLIAPIVALNQKFTDKTPISITAQLNDAYRDLNAILGGVLTTQQRIIAEGQKALLIINQQKVSSTIAGQPTSAGAGLLGGPNAANLKIADEAIGINNVNAALALTQERLANVQSAFTLVGGAVDQAFNALANGQDPLEALKQSLKQILVQLAKAAVFALILSAVSGGAGGVLGAAGGFLNIFKGLLGFKASGGGVRGGGAFMVGENGPELFVPGANGAMVNNNALRGAGAGAVSFEIRGDVLFGLLRKNGQNRAANFG